MAMIACTILALGTLPVWADEITVCPEGTPTCDYDNVQSALDHAADGDVIKIATGTYNTINNYGGTSQIAFVLEQELTLAGGYTTTNWTNPNPATYPTILDAQGNGRVLYITGTKPITVTGLTITGGNDAGLGGCPATWGGETCGSGVYASGARLHFSDNVVENNVSTAPDVDNGGGLFLQYLQSGSKVYDNHIFNNTAEWGGGAYIRDTSDLTFGQNEVISNTAYRRGGGVYFDELDYTTSSANTFRGNIASWGGGAYLYDNQIATLSGNLFHTNVVTNDGGAIHVEDNTIFLQRNHVLSNSARYGGGLFTHESMGTLDGNVLRGNTASELGGGAMIRLSDFDLYNNVIADNQVVDDSTQNRGSGIFFGGSTAYMRHNTLARNLGLDGHGIHLASWASWDTFDSHVTLTNTIVASHTVGLYAEAGSTISWENVLWGSGAWSNGANTGGPGIINSGTISYTGDPAFVDYANGDYHIQAASPARDRGLDTNLPHDVDGDPRLGTADIGADEYAGDYKYIYLPLVLKD
jgi:hypothetical protein